MKTMCPPGYHHKAIAVITEGVHCSHDNIYIIYLYIYPYIHIYIYVYIYHVYTLIHWSIDQRQFPLRVIIKWCLPETLSWVIIAVNLIFGSILTLSIAGDQQQVVVRYWPLLLYFSCLLHLCKKYNFSIKQTHNILKLALMIPVITNGVAYLSEIRLNGTRNLNIVFIITNYVKITIGSRKVYKLWP